MSNDPVTLESRLDAFLRAHPRMGRFMDHYVSELCALAIVGVILALSFAGWAILNWVGM